MAFDWFTLTVGIVPGIAIALVQYVIGRVDLKKQSKELGEVGAAVRALTQENVNLRFDYEKLRGTTPTEARYAELATEAIKKISTNFPSSTTYLSGMTLRGPVVDLLWTHLKPDATESPSDDQLQNPPKPPDTTK